MSTGMMMSLMWRRALKHFSPSGRVVDISSILNAASLAPTSFGVQPFQIYVVTNASVKEKISPAAYNQPQIKECSHLLVFVARSDASETVERCIKAHKFDDHAPAYANIIRQSLSGMDSAAFGAWSANQAHIALGFSMVAAADLRIGSCPMGGFDAKLIPPPSLSDDQIILKALGVVLNLPPNETVAVLMAVGTAPLTEEENAEANPFPKYNMAIKDLTTFIE